MKAHSWQNCPGEMASCGNFRSNFLSAVTKDKRRSCATATNSQSYAEQLLFEASGVVKYLFRLIVLPGSF